jgi:hypothetical protein
MRERERESWQLSKLFSYLGPISIHPLFLLPSPLSLLFTSNVDISSNPLACTHTDSECDVFVSPNTCIVIPSPFIFYFTPSLLRPSLHLSIPSSLPLFLPYAPNGTLSSCRRHVSPSCHHHVGVQLETYQGRVCITSLRNARYRRCAELYVLCCEDLPHSVSSFFPTHLSLSPSLYLSPLLSFSLLPLHPSLSSALGLLLACAVCAIASLGVSYNFPSNDFPVQVSAQYVTLCYPSVQ